MTFVSLPIVLFLFPACQEDNLVEDLRRAQKEADMLAAWNDRTPSTEDQARLRDIATRAREIARRYVAEASTTLNAQSETFADFRREDILNCGFTPDVQRTTSRADDEGKEILSRLADEMRPLEDEAVALIPELSRVRDRGREGPGAEIRRLHEQIHPRPSELANVLASDELAALLGIDDAPVGDLSALDHTVRHLRDDINFLNLLNGIGFSEEQMGTLVSALEGLEQARAESFAAQKPRLERALAEYRDAIERMRTGEDMDLRLQVLRPMAGIDRPGRAENEALDCVMAALTDGQKDVLFDYNPCLIPPQNLRDPVRVGQSNDHSGATRLMERVRAIPQEEWEQSRESTVDRILVGAEEHRGAFPDAERADVRARLADLCDRVRAMSDVDFELNKESLAEEASFLDRIGTLEDEALASRPREQVVREKVRQNLLGDCALPLLQLRLQQVRGFQPDPVDLERGPVAPSCRDGRCAVDD